VALDEEVQWPWQVFIYFSIMSHQDRMMIEEVKLRRKYLNEGDVFILDLGLHLIQVSHAWESV